MTKLTLAEARLDALVSVTSDVVYRMSADWSEMQPLDGRNLVASNAAPMRDWMERNLPADEHPRVRAAIAEAISSKAVFELEHRVVGPEGSQTWTHSRAVPLFDERGDIVEWIGLARDITASKRAEEALRESEQRFRSVFEQSTGGIAQVDLQGRFVLVNDRYCEIVGRSREELLALRMQDLTHPEDVTHNVSLFGEAVAGRIPGFTIEKRYLRPDGSTVWVQNAVSGTRGPDGRVRYITAIVADISDLRAAEELLRKNDALFRLMADASPAMLWLTDPEGRCTFLSREWYAFTGQTEEEALGLGWTDATHPDDKMRTGKEFLDANAATTFFRTEYRLRAADGTYRWAIDLGQPWFSETGEYAGMVGAVFDIDDRKRAEEELEEASRKKDQFLATLAHELRNPLAPISNALEVWPFVQQQPEKTNELREMMGRQVKQMVRLIDDLLDVSRITRGKVELRKQHLDLAVAVRAAVESMQPLVDAHRHELAVDLPTDPIFLEADHGRLVQVFGNLLDNAAKYTSNGGNIWVTVRRDGETAVVSVRDNGAGIPNDMLTDVFEMFTQVDQSLSRSHRGLGIGLTLVKSLVEQHGGSVTAKSDGPGHGSELVVRLPVAPVDRSFAGSLSASQRSLPALPSHRVLVVDDVKASADTLALMLENLGQAPRTVYEGAFALESFETFLPDVVFVDIAMPGMDGYEVARRIRNVLGNEVVLVALTGFGQEEDRRRAFEAGFDYHLVKPTSVEALHELLAGVPSTLQRAAN